MIFNITPYFIVGNFNAAGEPSRTEQLKNLKNKKKRVTRKKSTKKRSKKK
jgi:hypothetical protein